MSKRLKVTRKELLKEPDSFLSISQKVSSYVSQHKNNLLMGIGAIVVISALFGGYRYNQEVQTLRMESLYFKMVKIHDQKSDKGSQGSISEMEKLLGQFSAGPQQELARLLLAEAYFKKDNFDKAIVLYTDILQGTEAKNLSGQLAKMGLAYSYEGKKDYVKAVETYKSLVNKPDGFPLFDIYVSLARCYELNKDKKNALLTLREIEIKFQGHPQLQSVERRIARLSDQA